MAILEGLRCSDGGAASPPYTNPGGYTWDADLTISGDLTLSGTLTFGAVTLGATQVDGTLTVGEDDTGYDVKFFGATASKYWLWDESADEMIIAGNSTLNGTLTVGVDDTGYDVKLFGATAGSYLLWDESADELVLNAATLQLGGKMKFALNGGAASASGLLMGVGTSANPATTAAADSIFAEFRTQSSATSGDSRCFYMRHNISGAGGGGEALRSFVKVSAAASTCRGAHISVDVAATGTCSGFGAAVDAQVLIGDASITSNLNCLNAELYAAGSSTAIAARSASFLRLVVGGDATGVADIEGKASFLRFENAAGSGKIVDTDITALTGKAGLRVTDNTGALYGYIPIVTGS